MAKVEMELTIKADKVTTFINTIERIIFRENFSEQSQNELLELIHDCFGIGSVAENYKHKLTEANNTINRLANALYEEWDKFDNDSAYGALMDCSLLRMPMGDLIRK